MTTLNQLTLLTPCFELDVEWDTLEINRQFDPDYNLTDGFVTISVNSPLNHATGEYASLTIVRPCTLEVEDGRVVQFMGFPCDFDNVYTVGIADIDDSATEYNKIYLHPQAVLLTPFVNRLMDKANAWINSVNFQQALEAC